MSRYRFISGFRMVELLAAVGLIALLTWLALQEYRGYIRNAYAGDFMMLIQSAKTDALIDTAFYGSQATGEHKIVHSKKVEGGYTPFESLDVDNRGKVTLITPNETSEYWYIREIKNDFSAREISMYIHRTGTQAYGFNYLSCAQNAFSDSEESLTNIKKLDKTYYQYYCQ